MSPELFEKLDPLMSSSVQYLAPGSTDNFEELAELTRDFLSGGLDEPTANDRMILGPISDLLLSRGSAMIAFREPAEIDGKQIGRRLSDVELGRALFDAIEKAAPSWERLRLRIKNVKDTGDRWRPFPTKKAVAEFLGVDRKTPGRWLKKARPWIRQAGKLVSIDTEHPKKKSLMGH